MTHGLSAAELAQIRDDLDDLLPDTCNILGVTRTSDGAGGWTETWGTISGGTAVPCRVDYRTVRDAVTGERLKSFSSAVLTLNNDVIITTAHRVEIGSAQWAIKGVNVSQSWLGAKRADIEKA